MSAAPSWPLISSPLWGEPSEARFSHRPRVEFSTRPEASKPNFRILILTSSVKFSERKTTRGALDRTRPSNLASSRTEKARNCLSPNGLRRKRRRSRRQPCFRAAAPIWDGNRGDSRGKPTNPHTFLCTARGGLPHLHAVFHLPVMAGLDPAIHVSGGRSPDRAGLAPRLSGDGIEV